MDKLSAQDIERLFADIRRLPSFGTGVVPPNDPDDAHVPLKMTAGDVRAIKRLRAALVRHADPR